MKLPENDASEDDPRVLQSAREFLAEMEAGRQPDRHTFYARNPDLKPLLEECFDGIELAHGAGLALRPGPTPAHAEIPSAPLGDFKIVREIGRGGMGIVYEAVQLSLGRRVALKVLPFAAALDAKHLQRFKTEAHAAAQLHHTNIVPVYAVGCERGMHFYAMQLIDGRPLDRVIREMKVELEPDDTGPTINARDGSTRSQTSVQRTNRSRKSFRTAALLAAQVAEALEYAHEAGVVHRDVKPANLIIDAKGTVWVTDFGLAQVTADVGLTQTGDVFGTLRYMSPEQASGRRAQVDHRTDVYSLGATLYEFLALEPLFPGQDRQTLLNQILNEEPRSPRHIDRSIPVELETIVLKALAKSPEERYATAGEMAADLRRFLDERPILARRPSLVDRTRKWVRRHPSTMGATLVLLILIVVGLAAATALIAREQGRTQEALDGERQRAEEAEQRFRLARGAADDMITMAEVELADQPHLHNLRRRLLETALAYYQQFIELRRYDSSAQMELAATRDKVKLILDDLAIMDGQGQLFLLDVPAVLDDLKLSDEQRLRLVELTRRLVALRQELFKDFYLLSSEERKHRYLELARTNDAGVSEILSKDHKKRLGQIDLQMKGISAFQNPNVLRELKLSSEQREQIHMVEAEFNHHGGPPGGPGGPKDPDPKERPDRKDPGFRGQDWRTKAAFAKIEKILQSEQWAKWQEMIGEPVAGGIRVGPGGPFGGPPGPR